MSTKENSIETNLKSCPAIFIEKLIVSFGDEAITKLENTSTIKAKRDLLELLILESDDTTTRMMTETIQEIAKFINDNQASLKISKEEVHRANEIYKADKQSYQENLQVKLDALDDEYEIDKDKYSSYQLKLNKARSLKLGESVRHRSLVELAKGAISATIDGVESQYSKTAYVIMHKAIQDTKAVIRNFNDISIPTDTLEGRKAIEEAVLPTCKKISEDTSAGKNDAMLHAQLLAAQYSIATNLDLSSDSLASLENKVKEENRVKVMNHIHGEEDSQ